MIDSRSICFYPLLLLLPRPAAPLNNWERLRVYLNDITKWRKGFSGEEFWLDHVHQMAFPKIRSREIPPSG